MALTHSTKKREELEHLIGYHMKSNESDENDGTVGLKKTLYCLEDDIKTTLLLISQCLGYLY